MKLKIAFNRKVLWFCFESNSRLKLNETTNIICDFQYKVNLGLSSQTENQTN